MDPNGSPLLKKIVVNSALALLGLALVAPAGGAIVGVVGSQLLLGDYDQVPGMKSDSKAFQIVEADFGVPGDVNDNCLVLRTQGVTAVIVNKDLRLTRCAGGPSGTEITDTDVVERQATWMVYTGPAGSPDTHMVYADINGNGKFDKGDSLYATTKPLAGTETKDATVGFVPTTAVGMWTVRITPVAPYEAGTFVRGQDADSIAWSGSTRMAQAFADRMGSIVEREDKQWFWINGAVASAKKFGAVPLDSVRLNKIVPLSPLVSVNKIEVPNAEVPAGLPFNLVIELENKGKLSGQGLLATRLDDTIVDARISPLMSPAEKTTLILPLTAPRYDGTYAIHVNEAYQLITVTGGAPAVADSVEALAKKVSDLEARLAKLEGPSTGTSGEVAAQGAGSAKAAGSAPATPLLVVALALVAMAFVRPRA